MTNNSFKGRKEMFMDNIAHEINLSDKNKSDFIKAMKIGYYKEFHKQGLITDTQLEQLIRLQTCKDAA